MSVEDNQCTLYLRKLAYMFRLFVSYLQAVM